MIRNSTFPDRIVEILEVIDILIFWAGRGPIGSIQDYVMVKITDDDFDDTSAIVCTGSTA